MRKNWRQHNLKLKRFERNILPKRYRLVAGVDEAGRGPLAGPVVAGAVILKESTFSTKIFDSKQLSSALRQAAFKEIMKKAYVGIGIVDKEEIDEKNIFQATISAIKKAIDNLGVKPEYVLVDGRFKQKNLAYPSKDIVKGDCLCLSIACASIVAKVVRDSLMSFYAMIYPQYGFNRNRGYFTQEHIRAVKKYGLCPIHRTSFKTNKINKIDKNY